MSGFQIRPVGGIFSGRRKLVAVVLVLLAVAAGWKLLGKGGGRPGMSMDAPPVRVATSLAQNVPHFLNGLGTVLPSGDVLVTSRVDGQLLHLHFAEGQRVNAGDLLAEIDPRPFQASLDQALGNLSKDKAQLENARNDLGRYAKLAQGNYIAAQQYETQRALVRMLREAGAKEVHVRISSPPVQWPCFYGIDFATRAELIAPGLTVDEIRRSLGADSLGYISLDGLTEATAVPADELCRACFDGQYPIAIPPEQAKLLNLEEK